MDPKSLLDKLHQLDEIDIKLFNLFSCYKLKGDKPASKPYNGSVTILACELNTYLAKNGSMKLEQAAL